MTNGPLIVQSDKTALLEVDHPDSSEARHDLAIFAELERAPEHIHTYRITRLGLWNARAAGHDSDFVLNVLDKYAKFAVPSGVRADIAETMNRYGRLSIRKSPTGELELYSTERAILLEASKHRKIAELLDGPISNEAFRIQPWARGQVKQELLKLGWPAEDFAGYAAGTPHEIALGQGDWKIRVEKVTTIPLTLGGKARFMIANVLAATLAAYLQGFKTDDISLSLQTFIPSAAQTPGRMNIFDFKRFKVLIDFAHNAAGYRGVEEYLSTVEATKKIGIIAGVGDRRDEDIKECATIAARMFDHIIIRQEKHLRGRTEEEIIGLIMEGINEANKEVTYEIIPKETEAIKHAINSAQDGSFITALSDVVTNAIGIVQEYLDKENEEA